MNSPQHDFDAEGGLYAESDRLAELATEALYAEQPALLAMGARGRAHTVEDFKLHFRALSGLDEKGFREYVGYCVGLFDARGFPQQWLTDAWRHMALVLERDLPETMSRPAIQVLTAVVG